MARIAFIQEEVRTRQGIMILSAVLKKHGHLTDVYATDQGHDNVMSEIERLRPHIIAFSTSTPAQEQALAFARKLKKKDSSLFIVMGGPHPTFYPRVLEENECLDAICIGEGEYALLELAENIGNNNRIMDIKNMIVRNNGRIYSNEVRPLIENLDDLPDPDRDIYFHKFPHLAGSNTKIFMIGRGCPFLCSYCSNKKNMEIYKGKGSYVRFKGINKIINEIKKVMQEYPMKWIQYCDDTFNINRKWLEEFLTNYKEKIGLGFLCNLRVDLIDEDLVRRLKRAGVDRIDIGVEHGNEEFRKRVLKRNITNGQIMNAGNLFNKYKIRFHSLNIVGFPEETLDLAFETVHINQIIKPNHASCGVLQPFPGTEIYNYVVERNLLRENININDFKAQKTWTSGQPRISSLIKQKGINELINLHCFFDLLVHYPSIERLVKILIKFPPNRFYQFISQWGMFKIYWKYANSIKEKMKTIKRAFRLLWENN